MEKYAPVAKDLASRDVVSRAITAEILDGRLAHPSNSDSLLFPFRKKDQALMYLIVLINVRGKMENIQRCLEHKYFVIGLIEENLTLIAGQIFWIRTCESFRSN